MKDNNWQPIETAPKNKHILLRVGNIVGSGRFGYIVPWGIKKEDGFYFDGACLPSGATEWQHLPEPPSSRIGSMRTVKNKDLIESILAWGNAARPNPDIKALCNQVGCHYEEFVEMMEALADYETSLELKELSSDYKRQSNYCVLHLDLRLENKESLKELIDSLADQIVTATVTLGLIEKLDYITSARDVVAEVNRANWSKTEHGKFVFDENGKVMKGKDYLPPNLMQFIK